MKKRYVIAEGFSCNKWKWDFLIGLKSGKVDGRIIHVPVMLEGTQKYRLVLEKMEDKP